MNWLEIACIVPWVSCLVPSFLRRNAQDPSPSDSLIGPILPAQELVMRSPGWHSDAGRYNDGGSDGGCGSASERSCSEAAWEVLSRLRRRLPLCWSPGGSVERSRLIQGVVLHQLPCSPLMLPALEG